MRRSVGLLASIVIVCLLAFTPAVATAKHVVHFEQTIAPGTTYSASLVMGSGDVLTLAWTADSTLKFSLVDPEGGIVRHSDGDSGSVIVDIPSEGNYTLKWENTGTTAVPMSYDYSVEAQTPLSPWVIAAVLIAIAALVVALFVAVIYRARKEGPLQPRKSS